MSSINLFWTASAVVLVTVLYVLWIGKVNNKWVKLVLDWFPAILFAYVLPATFTHISCIDLSNVLLHDLSRSWIIPFTILTVMSALSIKQLKIVGVKPIIVFGVGSLVIATLPVLLVIFFGVFNESNTVLFITKGYWKGLVPIVGGWIGGSTSQLVLKELAETPEALFLSILVLDNILVNIWTILMFQFIKRSNRLNESWGIDPNFPVVETPQYSGNNRPWLVNTLTIGTILLIMFLTSFVSMSFLGSVIILSIAGLVLGNIMPIWNHKLVLKMASFSIVLIMAILGLKLNFDNLSLPAVLVVLVVFWLALHFFAMLLTARLLKTNMAWVAIGSMANLGGISTAPAVTSAYKKELMPHAIVLAILSMVTGTGWGMLTIFLFRLL
ncbi:DUF819 family protein [Flagellimonas pacifica]|uniref:Uncharacterized membrane protein n=1 Tax=Flagellimonas pacifica TaxID=1247520 RepID=A0A285MCG8_9FLAO|nr:DUF819 family protein [Allomuricauda parva]SNY94864.1 Uncharacterized membrane protein [Allomuricauda parva]